MNDLKRIRRTARIHPFRFPLEYRPQVATRAQMLPLRSQKGPR
jgi:hypothetical protein